MNAISNFNGTIDELESVIDLLHLGHHIGWKVLYVVHSKTHSKVGRDSYRRREEACSDPRAIQA